MQQEEGQAFWISRARAQHVQTAMVPITSEQVRDAWQEIHRQEEMQRSLLDVEERRRQEQQVQKQAHSSTADKKQPVAAGAASTQQIMQPDGTQKKRSGHKTIADKKQQQPKVDDASTSVKNEPISAPVPSPSITPAPPILSSPDDDDEPDRL